MRAEKLELPTSGEEGKEKERRRRRGEGGDDSLLGCEVIPMFGRVAQNLKSVGQAQRAASPAKNHVTSKSPVGDMSVVTLIRTDITFDHSQKAEKIYFQSEDLH